jgi:hypothetical protein
MKIRLVLSLLALALLVPLAHADKIVAGPKGGRLLEAPPHHAEFFVSADRHVEINYYNGNSQPVDHAGHTVSVVVEKPGARQTLTMTPRAHGFVSAEPLPAGEPYRVVVQFRTGPQAKAINYRIDFNPEKCGECGYAEYACTCGH